MHHPTFAETEPATIPMPLAASDLDRHTNPGRIYQLHRATVKCPPCDSKCEQGDFCPHRMFIPAEACTEVGADQDKHYTGPVSRWWLRLIRRWF